MLRYVLLICMSMLAATQAQQSRTELTDFERLRKTLLTTLDYQKVRPGDQDSPTNVVMYYYLYKLNNIDGKSQIMQMTGQVHMNWRDERLAWNPDDYGGTTLLMLYNSDIWIPPIGLRNSVELFINEDVRNPFPVFVHYDGEVMMDQLARFHSTCELNMQWFPFDTQECALKFGTLSQFSPASINISIPEGLESLDTTYLQENEEWSLLDAWVTRTGIKEWESESPNSWRQSSVPELQIWFSVQRSPIYYALNIVVPVMCLAFLSMMAFLVPFDNGEKIGMSMTILLAFSVFMLILGEHTPPAAKEPPILAIYLSLIVGIISIQLVVQTWILSAYHIYPIRPLPRFLQGLTDCLACCHPGSLEKLSKGSSKKKTQDVEGKADDRHRRHDDRRDRDGYPNGGYRRDEFYDDRRDRRGRHTQSAENVHPTTVMKDLGHRGNPIPDEEIWKAEWRQFANVVDRVLFILFATVNFILVTILFFIMFPLKLKYTTGQGSDHTNVFDNFDYENNGPTFEDY